MVTSEKLAQSTGDQRLEFLRSALSNQDWSKLRILDVGCGNGFVSNYLASRGANVTGIDAVPFKSPPDTWNFVQIDLNDKNWTTHLGGHQRFDCVCAFDVIEHVDSPWLLLEAFRSIMGQNGKLVLSTPNVGSWERFRNPTGWSGANDPQHKFLFNAYSLAFMLDRSHFSTLNIQAPIRKLGFLNRFIPRWGGQLQAVAIKNT